MGAVMASAQLVEIAEAFTVAAEGRCGAQTITPMIVSRARKARVREVRSRMCTDVLWCAKTRCEALTRCFSDLVRLRAGTR
jgi:hypothetical protein